MHELNEIIVKGLQGQAVFKTKLSFRPHSTESHTHKKMILSMVDKSNKKSGIKVISMVSYLSKGVYIYLNFRDVVPVANLSRSRNQDIG